MAPLINQLVGNNRNLGYLLDGERMKTHIQQSHFLDF